MSLVVGLWFAVGYIQQLPAERYALHVTVAKRLALGGNVGSSWVSDFTAVPDAFGALPEGGLFGDGVPCLLPSPLCVVFFRPMLVWLLV